jgi:hypothetical protein
MERPGHTEEQQPIASEYTPIVMHESPVGGNTARQDRRLSDEWGMRHRIDTPKRAKYQ